MKRKRRVEVTVETSQRLIVRHSAGDVCACCVVCGGEMVSLDGAAMPRHLAARTLRLRAENAQIHFAEKTPAGSLLVCLDSLVRQIQH